MANERLLLMDMVVGLNGVEQQRLFDQSDWVDATWPTGTSYLLGRGEALRVRLERVPVELPDEDAGD